MGYLKGYAIGCKKPLQVPWETGIEANYAQLGSHDVYQRNTFERNA